MAARVPADQAEKAEKAEKAKKFNVMKTINSLLVLSKALMNGDLTLDKEFQSELKIVTINVDKYINTKT